MRISVLRLAVWALALTMCVLLVSVHSYPQLFREQVEPDQEEASDESEVVDVVSPLTRTRRGSQIASYGHHQPSYSHGHDHGWGHTISPKSHTGHHGGGAVGPVFTYVRTDKWGNFQWGVRHRAGGHGWHGR